MKKSIIFGVLIVIIISFGTTFYFQHQAFSEQKATMKSNFSKKQKANDKQVKELQTKNAELENLLKANEEKIKVLQDEISKTNENEEQKSAIIPSASDSVQQSNISDTVDNNTNQNNNDTANDTTSNNQNTNDVPLTNEESEHFNSVIESNGKR